MNLPSKFQTLLPKKRWQRRLLEAGLIVGIVMAATRGVAGRGRWISIGVAGGVIGAAVVYFLKRSADVKKQGVAAAEAARTTAPCTIGG